MLEEQGKGIKQSAASRASREAIREIVIGCCKSAEPTNAKGRDRVVPASLIQALDAASLNLGASSDCSAVAVSS